MRVDVFDTPAEIGERLADEIMAGMRDAGAAGRAYLLGCPTGRSPMPVYAALGARLAAEPMDLSHLVIVLMDEFVLPAGNGFAWADPAAHYSCRGFAGRDILPRLNAGLPAAWRLRPDQVWAPDPVAPDGDYDRRIAAAGGIDLFILASGGSDGHVAFNPPGSAADSVTRVVALAEATRRDNLGTFPQFRDIAEVPRHGATVGIATMATLTRAARMVLWGANKREAYARISAATGYDPAWPATMLALCPDAALLADHAAS